MLCNTLEMEWKFNINLLLIPMILEVLFSFLLYKIWKKAL